MYPTQGGRSRLEHIVQSASDAYLQTPAPERPGAGGGGALTLPPPLLGHMDPFWALSEPFRFSFLVFNVTNLMTMDGELLTLDWVTIMTPLCRRRLMFPPALHVYHEVIDISFLLRLFGAPLCRQALVVAALPCFLPGSLCRAPPLSSLPGLSLSGISHPYRHCVPSGELAAPVRAGVDGAGRLVGVVSRCNFSHHYHRCGAVWDSVATCTSRCFWCWCWCGC